MDDGVGLIEIIDPRAGVEAVPRERAPRRRMRVAREYGDLMACGVEMPREKSADLSRAAGDEDAHGSKIRDMGGAQKLTNTSATALAVAWPWLGYQSPAK
jgi:hypothetical protein